MMLNAVLVIATASLAIWIAIVDARRRCIPNIALIGLISVWTMSVVLEGADDVFWRVGGALGVVLIIGLPLYMTGLAGGGDVKFIAVAVLLVPAEETWNILFLFYAVFVIHALVIAVLCLLRGAGLRGAAAQLHAYPLGVPLGFALAGWTVLRAL